MRKNMKKRINRDESFKTAIAWVAWSIFALTLLLIGVMTTFSWPAIQKFGWGFLISSHWDPVQEFYGALPFIYGTVVSSLLALLIAVPVSLGIAIYLSELAPQWIKTPLGFMIELLAAVPSIILGLWGIFVLVPLLRNTVEPFLGNYLGFLPLFQGPKYGVGMLAAGIILSIMIIPTISSISREVFSTIPVPLKEAALAIGSTRWEMVKMTILPYGRSGVLGAILLGLGRALGETMAVTMVIGNRPDIAVSLFAPSHSMAAVIANEFTEATSDMYLSALMEVALVLFALTLLLNILARLLIWSVSNKLEAVPA
ncbi:MAG: phosphate ABC transporter permease subunit PstC [Candidatus Omnitrophica bacterium]|nr:phosphate ABC transporter permease subunit PstC [Candidatus Omnitrophota bacterium]